MYIAYTYPYNQSYHTYAYIHLYICTSKQIYITHICANVHICIYTNMHICCMHAYIHVTTMFKSVYTSVYACLYACVCVCVYVYRHEKLQHKRAISASDVEVLPDLPPEPVRITCRALAEPQTARNRAKASSPANIRGLKHQQNRPLGFIIIIALITIHSCSGWCYSCCCYTTAASLLNMTVSGNSILATQPEP